jgi:MFS family permease
VAALGSLAGLWLIPTRPAAAGRVFARPDRALVVLGVITFCGLFGESAAADWSAVYLRTAAHATPAVAAWGYAAFSLAMAAGRLAGDRLVGRFGPALITRVTALTGAAGLAVGLATPYVPVVIAGFVLLGLGVATVVPLTFSAAGRTPGHDPGTAVAAVATVGYGGWMIAPPVIGLIAQGTSITVSLTVVAAMTALIAAPARALDGRP